MPKQSDSKPFFNICCLALPLCLTSSLSFCLPLLVVAAFGHVLGKRFLHLHCPPAAKRGEPDKYLWFAIRGNWLDSLSILSSVSIAVDCRGISPFSLSISLSLLRSLSLSLCPCSHSLHFCSHLRAISSKRNHHNVRTTINKTNTLRIRRVHPRQGTHTLTHTHSGDSLPLCSEKSFSYE